jgi:hypothetical protein
MLSGSGSDDDAVEYVGVGSKPASVVEQPTREAEHAIARDANSKRVEKCRHLINRTFVESHMRLRSCRGGSEWAGSIA